LTQKSGFPGSSLLVNLLDHDETLFYRTIMSDPARFLPIGYDPTIGEVP
jgi:malate dehydrogenase (oxaloacetate-decarboxylating)(NADP+)